MSYIVSLPYNEKLKITTKERGELLAAIESREDFFEVGGSTLRIRSIQRIDPIEREKTGYSATVQRALQEFADAEAKYRKQGPREKAKCEYYSRFMWAYVHRIGFKQVFGARGNRKQQFDGFIKKQEQEGEVAKGLKNFFVEYFEKNQDKTWMPYQDWEGFLPGELPSYFEVIVKRHDDRVERFYSDDPEGYDNEGFDRLPA